MDFISFDDWKRLDLRVGEIRSVERIPNTDKLYRLEVDIGADRLIQTITSLVDYYTEEQLQGRKIVVLTNLEPKKFAGELSQGMLLCAEKKDGSECVLLTVEKDIAAGTPIT